ncbi:MAG: hypothetical protein HZA46_01615, partial [Planctomycetales bacterium]|nr:hypothetical protein [Planctomycetales bacterium]
MKLSTIFRKAGLRLGLVMRRRRRSRVLSGIERLEERHLLSAVIVDQGFGDNGVVALQIDAPREWRGTSVLTDQGGRVSFITGRPEATEILLLRQDGEIDGDHGSASERVVSGLLTTMSVQDIGVQPDGKMVVVGHSRDTGDQVVARFRRP